MASLIRHISLGVIMLMLATSLNAQTSEEYRNRLKSAMECYVEINPGTCQAGGPPPTCTAGHWIQGDCQEAWHNFEQWRDTYLSHQLKESQEELRKKESRLPSTTVIYSTQPNSQEIVGTTPEDISKAIDLALNTRYASNDVNIDPRKAILSLMDASREVVEISISQLDNNFKESSLGKSFGSYGKMMTLASLTLDIKESIESEKPTQAIINRAIVDIGIGMIPVVGVSYGLATAFYPKFDQWVDSQIDAAYKRNQELAKELDIEKYQSIINKKQ